MVNGDGSSEIDPRSITIDDRRAKIQLPDSTDIQHGFFKGRKGGFWDNLKRFGRPAASTLTATAIAAAAGGAVNNEVSDLSSEAASHISKIIPGSETSPEGLPAEGIPQYGDEHDYEVRIRPFTQEHHEPKLPAFYINRNNRMEEIPQDEWRKHGIMFDQHTGELSARARFVWKKPLEGELGIRSIYVNPETGKPESVEGFANFTTNNSDGEKETISVQQLYVDKLRLATEVVNASEDDPLPQTTIPTPETSNTGTAVVEPSITSTAKAPGVK